MRRNFLEEKKHDVAKKLISGSAKTGNIQTARRKGT
jgi:hypothetical protein